MSQPIFSQRNNKGLPTTTLIIIAIFTIVIAYMYYSNDDDSKQPDSTSNSVTTEQSSTRRPDLSTEVVVEGLSHPWEIAFLPDGTMIFTERAGEFYAHVDDSKKLIGNIDNVEAEGEGGLLGLAVDAQFTKNKYIYMCYNAKIGSKTDVRVTRFSFNAENLTLGEGTDIVTGIPSNNSGRHSGCRLNFSDSNQLWITTGDAENEKNPQSETSLGGKVLRVDRNGKGVSGNLPAPFDNRIFNYGHRNLQGLALIDNPSDGIYGVTAEHGTDVDDEINLLRTGNFGWQPGKGYDEAAPMTDKEKFPDAIDAIWSSGDPTIAISGATFINSTKWEGFDGWLVVAVLKDKKLMFFNFDEDFSLTETVDALDDRGRIRTVVQGPDDALYIATDNGDNDQIIKVTPKK